MPWRNCFTTTLDCRPRSSRCYAAQYPELRSTITSACSRRSLTCLIYYAGHGHKDVSAGRAYWLPVDAHPTTAPTGSMRLRY